MTNLAQPTHVLMSSAKHFEAQNAYGLKFESECLFAKQQITRNNFTFQAAQKNPDSLKAAILNVAAIGMSLNPATAHAYLVPRDGAICLDISYRGLVKLATDSGAIEWAKAVLVYEGDTFKWKGPATPPEHEADVFAADRIDASEPLKNLKGGYCLAKLAGGEYMVEVMTAGEIFEVKNSSKAQNGPWAGKWAGEMAKKTLVKRASKSWPQSAGRDRIDAAIHVLNQHEGIDEREPVDEPQFISQEDIDGFVAVMADGDPFAFVEFMDIYSEDQKVDLFNSAPKGQKTKWKDAARRLEREAHATIDEYADNFRAAIESQDELAVSELASEMSETEKRMCWARLTDIEKHQIKQLREGAAA